MEDNEFEEVTIISHTDHGTSVLPQSTAERLMKEIKLEVTQKISQNENVKLGSLQHSTTPTLLDSIYQNVHANSLSVENACWFNFSLGHPLASKWNRSLLHAHFNYKPKPVPGRTFPVLLQETFTQIDEK